jgi:hypothetical protein
MQTVSTGAGGVEGHTSHANASGSAKRHAEERSSCSLVYGFAARLLHVSAGESIEGADARP